jgi:serine/threonine protein kinase
LSSNPLQPGDRLGNYILHQTVGKGAFATVWKAIHHERPGRVVARKVATDLGFRKQLSREGRLPEIQHPNVVPILDCDTRFADNPYVVMPLYDEGTLADLIARHPNGLPADRVDSLLRDILAGLSAAHDRGIIHRDLKPSNILLDSCGRAMICDFGLSLVDEALDARQSAIQSMSLYGERASMLAGTLAYLAPEVLSGEPATKTSDVYSVGVLLFEMLTGRRPAGVELPSESRKDLRRPAYFDALFCRACPRKGHRYQEARAVAQDMEKTVGAVPSATPGAGLPTIAQETTAYTRHRLTALQILIGTVILCLTAVIVVHLQRGAPKSRAGASKSSQAASPRHSSAVKTKTIVVDAREWSEFTWIPSYHEFRWHTEWKVPPTGEKCVLVKNGRNQVRKVREGDFNHHGKVRSLLEASLAFRLPTDGVAEVTLEWEPSRR